MARWKIACAFALGTTLVAALVPPFAAEIIGWALSLFVETKPGTNKSDLLYSVFGAKLVAV